ncbi:helix-turn-helix domain-containing protein [Hathewaya limosa]|uniref:Transcriptional regulator with XRE-family HTH domain n=1 Tax=Hathewaya limosa TaxID=1536 RepID=A0ABU0JTZ9_HATLI|nr:helix-turn-helix transcriptional regulator [Hathewaya limosa]MDQ0480539.1 transcriptional regulator with XRE-family HTH domain [Hathewaya limosa]
MNYINIAKIIKEKRKEKGITQEELANYLSISKPAVSKWESGQSYPDITILPILASFFGITVDDLIGYEPQLSKEEVANLYKKLSSSISKDNFEEVFNECEEYAKKYYSCWILQEILAQLYLNYSMYSKNPNSILENALNKCVLVSENSKNNTLVRESIAMQATCYLVMNKPSEVINLLEDLIETPIAFEVLLSSAYFAMGENKKGHYQLQKLLYNNTLESLQVLIQMMTQSMDNTEKFYDYFKKAVALGNVFDIPNIHPAIFVSLYFTAANGFITQNKKELALDTLEEALKGVQTLNSLNFELKGNEFFDLIDNYFEEFTLGKSAPRNKSIIIDSFKEFILNNPLFEALKSEPRYLNIIDQLKHL